MSKLSFVHLIFFSVRVLSPIFVVLKFADHYFIFLDGLHSLERFSVSWQCMDPHLMISNHLQ